MSSKSLALLAALATAVALFGQSQSSISGIVTDPSGAVLPGTSISITSLDTNAGRETKSDASGRYNFAQLQPGNYKLQAKASGFNEVTINEIHVLVNTPATIDVHVETVGATSETVSVMAESVQINTVDATLGNAIGTKPIMELPFEARNVVGLLSIQPGVTFFGDPSDYRSGAVNGGKSDQGNVTLDGVDVNDQQYRSAFTSVLRVTLDSIQEFRTTTTNGNADSGRTSGAQVALVTKGGTNQFHGSAYEYHRNTITSANSFFNNSDGIERQKLIRNVFGVSLGGPIKKDKLFFFLNYEGRRDASDSSAVRTVPTALFRQGTFTYQNTAGQQVQLSPDQVRQVDPTGQGESPAVLNILKTYPMPNDTTVGDGLNTAGYRFKSSVPLTYNTYISRLDYQIGPKHILFWRGNLQNDDFVEKVPEFPTQANASQHLENSKGFAIGYTWLPTAHLVSNLHYGFTRQGFDSTGIQSTPIVYLRDIDNPIANSKGLSAIIPVHDLEENMTWTRGAHTVQFGGSYRSISTNRLNYGNSFSGAGANSSWFADQGQALMLADVDPNTNLAYTRQMTNILGYITEGDAQYNYDKQGNLLAQGVGIKRNFVNREGEFYGQDSWKIRPNLTITGGLRVSLFPPLREANGYQTSSNLPLSDWFNIRGGLAETGQSQALAPELQFNLAGGPGGRPLYPYQKHVSPRLALAWSPSADSGWRKWLLGSAGKTSIRAGAGLFYDLFGQSLIRLADATALGFSTQLSNPATATYDGTPRYISPTQIPDGLLPAAPAGGFPQTAPNAFAIAQGLDSGLRAPYTMNLTFSMSRDFGKGLLVTGSYVGRLSRRSLQADDVAAPTNLLDKASGMTYFQAATIMQKYVRAHPNATAADVAGLSAIPFFENLFSGSCFQRYDVHGGTISRRREHGEEYVIAIG
ncbi:MAG: carboxypeptidase-like regulatory domain-containing protein [Bryobacteraceae bacterium]